MKTQTATALAVVFMLLLSAVGGAGAVTPDTSLAADFDSSTTTTVYVTPGVSQSTRDNLQSDGYTVDTSPGGVIGLAANNTGKLK